MGASTREAGVEALNLLKSTDPPLWLAPDSTLSHAARTASWHIFSSLRPFAPKSPFENLLVDGFDAEQIWQQIDMQSQPILSIVRRDLKRFENNREEILKLKVALKVEKKGLEEKYVGLDDESDGFDEKMEELDEEDGEDDEEEDSEKEGTEDDENEDGIDGDREAGDGIEDGFLKLKELEEFLEEDEAREYGLASNKSKEKEKEKQKKNGNGNKLKKNKEVGKNDEETDDEDEEFGEFGIGGYEDEDDGLENAKYEDFFGTKKKQPVRKQSKLTDQSEELDMGDEEEDGGAEDSDIGDEEEDGAEDSEMGDEEEEDGEAIVTQKPENLSTHEKQLKRLQSEIEQMEKANLEPKTWTMQGEVSAAKRPMNSALAVDLDFEHNVRPAPVITEEITASLEEMIKKRISEGHFDDVQNAPRLAHEAPKQVRELDETKSKKGLGQLYEEEYVEKTNLNSVPSSVSDVMKQEASMLFKKLCVKFDALSHFYFTPKPVIESISVSANIPALAMEEIAPTAVSDAAMLAPEEVFSGKGDFKEEAELDRSERKKRRANKKRRYRAMVAKNEAKRAKTQHRAVPKRGDGKEEL